MSVCVFAFLLRLPLLEDLLKPSHWLCPEASKSGADLTAVPRLDRMRMLCSPCIDIYPYGFLWPLFRHARIRKCYFLFTFFLFLGTNWACDTC
jgi:hypothetical protein